MEVVHHLLCCKFDWKVLRSSDCNSQWLIICNVRFVGLQVRPRTIGTYLTVHVLNSVSLLGKTVPAPSLVLRLRWVSIGFWDLWITYLVIDESACSLVWRLEGIKIQQVVSCNKKQMGRVINPYHFITVITNPSKNPKWIAIYGK